MGKRRAVKEVKKEIWAKNIFFLRDEKGLSQAEFAEKIEVTKGQIAQIEQGRVMPSVKMLTKICAVFEVNANWILGISTDEYNTDVIFNTLSEFLQFESRPKGELETNPDDHYKLFIKRNLLDCLKDMAKVKNSINNLPEHLKESMEMQSYYEKIKQEFVKTINNNEKFVPYALVEEDDIP